MPRLVMLLTASAFAVASVPAAATILIYSSPGAVNPDQNVLFQGPAPVGNSAFGVTNETNTPVTFVGNEPLITPAMGQARIEAADGGLSELSFGLSAGLGFREVEFNIFGSQATADEVALNFTDQFGDVFSQSFAITSGQNFFSALAIDNQFITNVSFQLNGNVQDARQFRIGGIGIIPEGDGSGDVIPEPQTWAMLIVGFGLVGTSMRRRKTLPVTLA